MSELKKIDGEYAKWISDISKMFRQSQLKAAVKVNDEMLRFYWRLGHDISTRERKHDYGKAFVKNLSLDLQKELPDGEVIFGNKSPLYEMVL